MKLLSWMWEKFADIFFHCVCIKKEITKTEFTAIHFIGTNSQEALADLIYFP